MRRGLDGIEAWGLQCDLDFEVVVATATRWVGELVMGMGFWTFGPGGIFFGVRFAEKWKPSDEEQEQEQERGISVMLKIFLSKNQKMYSTNMHSTNTNRFIKHHLSLLSNKIIY